MVENFIKIAWRNLIRQRIYSIIKIGGLSIAIAACLLIIFFIRQELSYDKHYPDGDRIYRIVRTTTFKGERSKNVHFPAPFAAALQEDFADIEKVGRSNQTTFFGAGENELRRGDQMESTHEGGFIYLDQSLLEILQVSFISGNAKHALTNPKSILLTQSKAKKYFAGEDPIGKQLVLNNDNSREYTVTGVIADPPSAMHLQFSFVMTLAGCEFYDGEQSNWRNSNYQTYVMLRPGSDPKQLEKKLLSVVDKYFLPGVIEAGGDDELKWLRSLSFQLQPVSEIYLNLDEVNDGMPHGDIRYIGFFATIAFFILMIACINFVNLSTARSANRAKEVGLRKVVGSSRSSLVNQFLVESIVLCLFSFVLGLLLSWLLLPYFNLLTDRKLTFPLATAWLLPLGVVGAAAVGVLAGLYPSFYLSSFRPADVLKGNLKLGARSPVTRNALVIFQFTVSIILIAGTLIVDQQMKFMLNKKLGFDKEQVLVLQGSRTLGTKIVTFKDELLHIHAVVQATISDYLPIDGTNRNQNQFFREGEKKRIDETVGAQRWAVDFDYIKTLGIRILKGRDFSPRIHSDSQAVVINESMAQALNFNDPVGQVITNGWSNWTIIGVMEDFHFETMKEKISPLCIQIGPSNNTISVKLSTTDLPGAIQSISEVWKAFSPHQPIRYTFLDQSYARMYDDVWRMGQMFRSFAMLAIFIGCMGLFGLSAFMAAQRSREISIRRVLGASMESIVRLLTLNFLKMVVLSLIFAVPIALYLMDSWLEEFAYKIKIGWEVFALAGALSIVIASLTISYQALHAAMANPADGLRSE